MKIRDIKPGPHLSTTYHTTVIVLDGGKLYTHSGNAKKPIAVAPTKRYGFGSGVLALLPTSSDNHLELHENFAELLAQREHILMVATGHSLQRAEQEATTILGSPVRIIASAAPDSLIPLNDNDIAQRIVALQADKLLRGLGIYPHVDSASMGGLTRIRLELSPEQAMICVRALTDHTETN